jgi:hypothetical protein
MFTFINSPKRPPFCFEYLLVLGSESMMIDSPDLLQCIFNHFQTVEMLKLQRVCKQWHNLIHHHLTRRRTLFMNDTIGKYTCYDNYKSNKKYKLQYNSDQRKHWRIIRKYSKRVTHFICTATNKEWSTFFRKFIWRNITKLTLRKVYSHDLLEIMEKCPNLKTVNIKFLISKWCHNDTILLDTRVTAEYMLFPYNSRSILSLPESLKGLEICSLNVFPEDISALFVNNGNNMRYLRAHITTENVKKMCRKMPNLEKLNLFVSGKYPFEQTSPFCSISFFTKLKYLRIQSNDVYINDDSVTAISNCCLKLKHLTLNNVKLKDQGLICLSNLQMLKSINLGEAQILNEYTSIDILNNNKSLTSLVLKGSIEKCTDTNLSNLFQGFENVDYVSIKISRDEYSDTYTIGHQAAKSLLEMAGKHDQETFVLRIPGEIGFNHDDTQNCVIERDYLYKSDGYETFWLKGNKPKLRKHCNFSLYFVIYN